MKKPKAPVRLTVKDNRNITLNMRRITLAGEALADYPKITTTAYIKLLFDFNGAPLNNAPESLNDAQLRTYTIRHLDRENNLLSIDMAIHGDDSDTGPASHWARTAKPGDTIMVGGPGSSKGLASSYDWVLFAGDMTSLPAISTYLETLPKDTKGYAVIKVTTAADEQPLVKPDGIKLVWVSDANTTVTDVVSKLEWLPGSPAAWIACEFSEMRALRELVRNDKKVPHDSLYISSYWREGRSEDQHKIDKRKDMEAFDARG